MLRKQHILNALKKKLYCVANSNNLIQMNLKETTRERYVEPGWQQALFAILTDLGQAWNSYLFGKET